MTPEERLAAEEKIVAKARNRFAPIVLEHTDPYEEFKTVSGSLIGGGPRPVPVQGHTNQLSGDINKGPGV